MKNLWLQILRVASDGGEVALDGARPVSCLLRLLRCDAARKSGAANPNSSQCARWIVPVVLCRPPLSAREGAFCLYCAYLAKNQQRNKKAPLRHRLSPLRSPVGVHRKVLSTRRESNLQTNIFCSLVGLEAAPARRWPRPLAPANIFVARRGLFVERAPLTAAGYPCAGLEAAPARRRPRPLSRGSARF